ncbi:MAG: branched-chain amino acid ABC transporter permease, partial [Rhodoferax sp.]|nr:branched-chain amino acid ABC transporter permease [Rhodoferax sp.]
MLDPVFLAQTLVSGIGIGCVFGLIGIGYCVIYNASGIVNFAQGAFVMLGGMLTHALLTRAGLPLFVAAIISISLVAGLGVLVERFVVRPLWHRNATPFVMILATLAVQIVLERATLLVAGDQPKTLPTFIDLPPLMLGKVAISYQLMVIAVTSMVLVGLLALFFAQTRVGRAMRACSINREAAALQ